MWGEEFGGLFAPRGLCFNGADDLAGAAMTVFRLKQLASTSAHAAVGAIRWNYDRAELIADGIVHGIGVFGGVVAGTVLILLAAIYASPFEVAGVSVFVPGLVGILVVAALPYL